VDDENEVRLCLLEAGYEEGDALDIAKKVEEIVNLRETPAIETEE
jgi:hypothetical protein